MKKKTWERRILDAKKKHRPKLTEAHLRGSGGWEKDLFAYSREEVSGGRAEDFESLQNLPSNAKGIDVVRYEDLSVDDFIVRYERPYVPCIISDIPCLENWPAAELLNEEAGSDCSGLTATEADAGAGAVCAAAEQDGAEAGDGPWTLRSLRRGFGDRLFKVGEDDDGFKVKVKLKHFLRYLAANRDDSPLYVFDGSFDDDERSRALLRGYRVPSFFRDDLLGLAGERRRPPYRWFLVGPARSGSCVHVDPLNTSAWNTVVSGRKRWVLFPPDTPKKIAKGVSVLQRGEDDEAVNFFCDLLPRIRQRYPDLAPHIVEFIQEPGQTVFVPGGWWHGVLNLTHTVAVTQNFCSYTNFPSVWVATRRGRKKMAVKWLQRLREGHPDLAASADLLNERDGFVMAGQEEEPQPQPGPEGRLGKRARSEEEEGQAGKKRKKKKQKKKRSGTE